MMHQEHDVDNMGVEEQYAHLLFYLAKATGAQFDGTDAEMWVNALGSYPFRDVLATTEDLLYNSSEFVSFRRVRAAVQERRQQRIRDAGTPPPPPEDVQTERQYRQWLSTWRTYVANGSRHGQAEIDAAAASHAQPRSELARTATVPEMSLSLTQQQQQE